MTRNTPVERCILTSEGLRQDQGHGSRAQVEVSAYPDEIMVLAGDSNFGAFAICLHPDDAQHLMERLAVNIDLARSLKAEAAESFPTRLNADGDRMPVRDPQAEHSVA